MNFDSESHHPVEITFHGRPLLPNAPNEKSRWKRFLETVCPWLKKHHEEGEDYVRARVDREIADARKIEAETRKIDAEARKLDSESLVNITNAKKVAVEVAKLASEMDRKSSATTRPIIHVDEISAEDLFAELEEERVALEEKYKTARLLYGTRITIQSGKPVK